MKLLCKLFFVFYSSLIFGQSLEHIKKFRELEPDLWMGIWDKNSSDESIKIDTLSYDDIPKYLDFRGSVLEAIKWNDSEGEKLLIQTVTGNFVWKDYTEDSSTYMLQDKSELYAYLFLKPKGDKLYKTQWRIYDFTKCFGVDWYTGFIPTATTITDVNKNGISEISIPYILICRGDVSPGNMKVITYEGKTKYALRGNSMIMCDGDNPYGGDFQASNNLKDNELLYDFLIKHWERNKCERGRFY